MAEYPQTTGANAFRAVTSPAVGASVLARSAAGVAQGTLTAAGSVLQRAAMLWFLSAVAGQWLFVYYISAFYGPTLVSREYAKWDRNPGLTDGYVAGDFAGNLLFAAHVVLAAVLTFGGTLQLVPQIRRCALAFHRWNGRLFLVAAIAAACGGLYLEWVRGTGLRSPAGLSAAYAITLNATLILTCAWLAWRAVRDRDIASHQRWATRLFLVVNGTWFMRIGLRAWTVLTAGAFEGFSFFTYWSYGASLFPLLVYELYLRARTASAPVQYAMAASLGVLAMITGIGAAYTFLWKWHPLISTP